jgi:hypothetical protein
MTARKFSGRRRSGKAGGSVTKQRHGIEHYRRIGRLGGKARAKKSPLIPFPPRP